MSYYRSETINLVEKRADHFDYVDQSVLKFISSNINGCEAAQIFWKLDNKTIDLSKLSNQYEGYADLNIINNKRRINKHFEEISESLDYGDYFITAAETKAYRKKRIVNRFPFVLGYLFYIIDFLYHRLLAKLNLTKGFYFKLTKGNKRAISLPEFLGRLVSCGFQVIGHKEIGSKTYVISRKEKDPVYDLNPTYGALIKLNRIGLKGKPIQVYKIRTMHPYSEYIQDYVFKKNNLCSGGKLANDFRITTWGKIFRKFWIDELPMLFNLVKGEMKVVGVRPISNHYFSLYPEDMQYLRKTVKPGLIPPFYADLPSTLDEIIDSERKYINSYLKHPVWTDICYFSKATYNIICKRARSQ